MKICPYCFKGLVTNQMKLVKQIKYLEDEIIRLRIKTDTERAEKFLISVKKLSNAFFSPK